MVSDYRWSADRLTAALLSEEHLDRVLVPRSNRRAPQTGFLRGTLACLAAIVSVAMSHFLRFFLFV